jgi:hypothetical protein
MPFLAMALAVALGASSAGQSPEPVKLALPKLQSVNLTADQLDAFTDFLAKRLTERTIRVITAKEVANILGMARTQQLLGCDESTTSCMTELTDALGVDGLISGSIGKFGPTYQASLTVVANGDARLLANISVHADTDEEFLARLRSAAFEAAAEIGRRLGKPTRRYPRSMVSFDFLGAFTSVQLRPRYERALDEHWSMAAEVMLWPNRPSLAFPGLSFTELDVIARVRRHFLDQAPFGLFAGAGLITTTQYGFGTFIASGRQGAYGFAAGGITAEAGGSLLLFDVVGLSAVAFGHLGVGHFAGVDSSGGVSAGFTPALGVGIELLAGYAF